MGFGEAHGPRPFANGHFRQIPVFKLLYGVGFDGGIRPVRQPWIHPERKVRGTDKFFDCEAYGVWQSLTAIFWRCRQAGPSCLDEFVVGFLKTSGSADDAVFISAALGIAGLIKRLKYVLAKLCRFIENAGDKVEGCVLEAGEAAQLSRVENLVHDKAILVDRRFVAWHGFSRSSTLMALK